MKDGDEQIASTPPSAQGAEADILLSNQIVVHGIVLAIEEAQATLQAIRAGDVDAFVVGLVGDEPRVLLVEGADQAHHLLLGTLNEGAMTVSADSTILFANQRLAEMLARPLTEVLGQRLTHFIAPDDVEVFGNLLLSAAHGSAKGEMRFVRANDGLVPVMLSIRDIGQPAACFTVVSTDLSALKSAEAALRHANDDLEARVLSRTAELSLVNDALRIEIAQRKRLEDELRTKAEELLDADRRKDEFLSMLAHELRNPLAPILMAADLLRNATERDPFVERYRRVIDRQARNLARIVDDLLDVSRITRGLVTLEMNAVDIRSVMQNAIESTRPLIDTFEHELFVSIPPTPIIILGDTTRLEQIVVNLLNNAAKYTEPRGKIDITVTHDDGHVTIRVQDTGVGIAPDLLPHVFDLFVQGSRSLDRAQGGLGIGLTLVKSLVSMHGGTIEAHSEGGGHGSEFVVCLPLAKRDSTFTSPPDASTVATYALSAERQKRALIVEDNVDTANMLEDLLGRWSYDVRAVRTGEEAVAIAHSFGPDLVLLDIGLPGIDGFEVARRLRSGVPGPPIGPLLIGISGYGQASDRLKANQAGIDHHLVKPLDPHVLQELLRNAERRRETGLPP